MTRTQKKTGRRWLLRKTTVGQLQSIKNEEKLTSVAELPGLLCLQLWPWRGPMDMSKRASVRRVWGTLPPIHAVGIGVPVATEGYFLKSAVAFIFPVS